MADLERPSPEVNEFASHESGSCEQADQWRPVAIELEGCPYSPIVLFPDQESARRHIEKHLLGEQEAAQWALVIPAIVREYADIADSRQRHRLYTDLKRTEIFEALYRQLSRSVELNLKDACRLGWKKVDAQRTPWVGVAFGTSGALIVVENGVTRTVFLPGADEEAPWGQAGDDKRRRRMRQGGKSHREVAVYTDRWSQAEWLFYRVFRPALQFLRRAVYERLPRKLDPRARRNDYAMLKDCLPFIKSFKYEDWEEARRQCRGYIYNTDVN